MPPAADPIQAILSQLTLTEKCQLLSGKNMWETRDIPRLGIPSLKTTDGPAGVRGAKWTDGSHTTFIPCGISLAATFDKDLVQRVGSLLGSETRSKQAHILLAPTMNLSRSPLGGRNFENFGEEPFLTGVMATHYIRGIQSQGVGACMKHFVANDQETRRFNMNETIDERTLHEVYLKPFHMVTRDADPWAAMTSYPKINGEHADTSRRLVYEILRRDWGYEGLVMSDWGGLNSTLGSIRATTDLEMPGPPLRYGPALEEAVRSEQVSETENIDPAVYRMLRTLNRAGLLPTAADNRGAVAATTAEEDENVQTRETTSNTPEFQAIAREAAAAGIVLLKNRDNILPLDLNLTKRIAIIGPNARNPTAGGTGSAIVNPYYITNPLDSISSAARDLNPEIEIEYHQGIQTHWHLPLMGDILRTPDGRTTGLDVHFYRGHEFQGEVVATTHWQNSMVYLMSDGDIPRELIGQPYCFRALGQFTPQVTGRYDFSLSNTGQATLYIDGELFIDHREWSQICANFMNCSSPDKPGVMDLQAGVTYQIRIDHVCVPPPTPPHDNTLFHRIAGVKVGMLIQTNEEAMLEAAVQAAQDADMAIIIAGHNNDTEREGCDRTTLALPRRSDEFIARVCAVNPSTIVAIQSACAVSMPWAGAAGAIVQAWYQGQENGNALADILLGKVNPSGKLPVTFPHRLEDHGSHPWFPGNPVTDQATYGEGVFVGYRWADAQHIEPLWPFGFGLSYTSFQISDVRVEGAIGVTDQTEQATVHATVTNTGLVAGKEVLQLYISSSSCIPAVQRVVKSLVGFEKVALAPGESQTVRLSVGREMVAWYSIQEDGGEKMGHWRVDCGTYECYVGTSSRDIAAIVTLTVQ
ncbi:hypothetical protein AtubIFM57258_000821 [Aspergillus tubingensis]|nr:hypothetical protein AtubIFM57258_000821 [Aspergillus tubingensis]